MTKEARVNCVTPDGLDDDYRIDFVGGGSGNDRWKISIDAAISHIDSGAWKFYTQENGKRAEVIVKTHPTSHRRYLTTIADGYIQNNLSQLNTCLI